MILTVHVKANSRKSQVIAWLDSGTVKINISKPAKDGEANRELINFLAKKIKIAKSLINIKRGHSSRVKHIELPNLTNLDQLI